MKLHLGAIKEGPMNTLETRGKPNEGFTSSLLIPDDDLVALGRSALVGVALAAVYGLALGSRAGIPSMVTHAVGVPVALLAVSALGVPALYIVLALFDAPLAPRDALTASVKGCAASGLVLAGLAPLAAVYVVGSDAPASASLAGGAGLVLGGLLGLRYFNAALRAALATADSATRALAGFVQLAFAAFAIALASRVWTSLLPLLGGAA
jgi:hypothetical protein